MATCSRVATRFSCLNSDASLWTMSNNYNMEEKFVDIKGFEGVYRIGNKGTLLSLKKDCNKPIELSNVNKKGGYFSVVLRHGRKTRYTRIHRLVYEHFIGEIPKGHKWHIHHINGNKQDNRVENLELLSSQEHFDKDRRKHTTEGMNYYNKHIRPQIIIQKDLEGKFIAQYDNAAEASRETGVCARNILQVAGKEEFCPGHVRKQAGGFIWEQISRS